MSKQYLKTETEALVCYNEFAGECFDKDGNLMVICVRPDEREICENCIHGEQCYDNEDKQHCNIHDKSFEKNHSCDSVEVDKTK